MLEQWSLVTFREAIAEAIAHPETANLVQLWQEVEQQLFQLERDERLRAAGEVIAHLAEVHFSRAEYLLNGWEERWNKEFQEGEEHLLPLEPVLTEDMLSSFLRQTMSLNLDELLDDFVFTRNRTTPEDSVAGEVDKEVLLDWLEQEEKDKALAIAHDENVSEWVGMIRLWLEQHEQPAQFTALTQGLQQQSPHLGRVAIWLALLLGGFVLQSNGDFYARDFRVTNAEG